VAKEENVKKSEKKPRKAAAKKRAAKPKTPKKTEEVKQTKSPQTEHFSNDNMQIEVEKLGDCKVKLIVNADKHYYDKAKKLTIKQVSKDITLPGFRKGKAPEEMIMKKHGASVNAELPRNLANLIFQDAQNLVQLPILRHHNAVSYELVKSDPDQTEPKVKINYTCEVEPTVPDFDIKSIKLEKVKRHSVGDKEIDEAVRQMQFFYAKWHEVKRPIKIGDYVIIDLESLHLDPPEKVFADTRFEVTEKAMADWMRELLIGKKTDEVVEGTSHPDKTASEEEKKQFEPRKVRITIKKVEEAELPKLDDEFAKRAGANTVEEMKTSIAEMLNRQADDAEQREKREAVNRWLLTHVKFDLPHSLVLSEKQHRLKGIEQQIRHLAKHQQEQQIKQIDEQSKNAIALFYITKKIINQANIQITNEEINREAQAIYMAHNPHAKLEEVNKVTQDIYGLAVSRLMLLKAQDYILNQIEKA